MTRYFLTRIKVEGFRGINNESSPLELRFKPDTVNSVFAVNGVGKSSIFEALNYAIRGKIPKLDALQAQESPDDYICNRFHSRGEATIELDFLPDTPKAKPITILVTRDPMGARGVTSPSGHPKPEELLRELDQEFALLDYPTFGKFIDSTPLDRGRSFSALLGLSAYSDFRQTLQTVSDTKALNTDLELPTLKAEVKATQNAATRELQQMTAGYAGITGKTLSDVALLDTYASEVLSALAGIALVQPFVAGKKLHEIDFNAIKEKIKEAEGGALRVELQNHMAAIAELTAIGAADQAAMKKELDTVSGLFKERDELLAHTHGDLYRKLHEAGKALADSGEWEEATTCPLCNSTLSSDIGGIIKEQLAQYAAVSAKTTEIKNALKIATWLKRLGVLEAAKSLGVADDAKLATKLMRMATTADPSASDVEAAATALKDLEEKAATALKTATEAKEKIEKSLPASLVQLTEQVEFGRQFAAALKEYKAKVAIYATLQDRLKLRERWRDFIAKGAEFFAGAESALSQQKISAIDTEYRAMFNAIMGVDDVKPILRRSGQKEDLHVQLSDFHGQKNLSARALLSESYRNALAISVYLSAAMKHNGAPRFIVLDDVTSSFDSGHQWSLMEFIRNHLQQPNTQTGLQFILLSHDGLLEKYFDRMNGQPGWSHQRLQGMPPLGAVMSQAQDANRLHATAVKLLDAGQVKEAEPLIRQYLEYKLTQIISKVGIPVPMDFAIKDTMKMVSNSLNAIEAAVKLHKAAGSLILDAQQIKDLTTIHVPALVGNWVTHYETSSGASVTPPVLKGVLATIDKFAECFRYDDTSTTPLTRKWYSSLASK